MATLVRVEKLDRNDARCFRPEERVLTAPAGTEHLHHVPVFGLLGQWTGRYRDALTVRNDDARFCVATDRRYRTEAGIVRERCCWVKLAQKQPFEADVEVPIVRWLYQPGSIATLNLGKMYL